MSVATKALQPLLRKLEAMQTTQEGACTGYVAAVVAAWEQTAPLPDIVLAALETSSSSWLCLSESRRNAVAVGIVLLAPGLSVGDAVPLLDTAVRTLRRTRGSVAKGTRLRCQDIIKKIFERSSTSPTACPAGMALTRSPARACKLLELISAQPSFGITIAPGLGIPGVVCTATLSQTVRREVSR